MTMFRVALGTVIVVGSMLVSCSGHGSEDGGVPLLTKEIFEETIKEKPQFVMFFAPWCGHCKKLAPVWEELHESLGGFTSEGVDALDVGVAKVDCTQQTALCSQYSVTGYPTLKFFKSVEENSRYKGSRSLEELTLFVKKEMGLIKEPAPVEESSGPVLPTVFTEDDFDSAVAKGHHFIKFYAPWCGHCQRLAPVWDQLAESCSSISSITIGKVDCTQHKKLCTKHGVRGYPTLLWFTDGQQVGEKYAGDRTIEGLRTFTLEQAKSQPSQPIETQDDDKQGSDSNPSPPETESFVSSLNKDNFEESVAEGVTMVKFFAPWCGHCKKMAGAYQSLGAQLRGHHTVTIAEVDCTDQGNRDLCAEQQVKGFPTILVYRDGSVVETYEGDRSTADMAKFVTAQLKHDEL